ncbi:MAG: hypothetical protein WD067_09015 [Gaiellaceae bacterium]
MRLPSIVLLYLIAGVVVAAIYDYFDHLGTGRQIGEAIIAIVVWPILFFGVDIDLR